MERILDLKSIKTNINIFFILVYTECTLNIFYYTSELCADFKG